MNIDPNKALEIVIEAGRPWIQQYGLLAVGLGLFTETLIFTGVIVPGYGILVAAGYFIASGALPALPTLLIAWFCAILGDQASYAVGWLWGSRLLQRKKEFAERLRKSLEEEGRWLLLTYHYAPTLRAIIPCVAGFSRYDRTKWIVYDSLGVLAWVLVVLGTGYSAHGALRQGSIFSQVISVMATLMMLFVTYRIYKRLTKIKD